MLKDVVSISIISSDLSDLRATIDAFNKLGVSTIHLDVMDGMFVPNITFGPGLINSIRPLTKAFFDCHLMIEEPIRYIAEFIASGVNSLVIHPQACSNALATLQEITSHGIKCGIAVSPEVAITEVERYLDYIDLVLVMSVQPGFAGQKFLANSLAKLQELKERRKQREYLIGIDGGIDDANIEAVITAGADYVVSASYVFQDLNNNYNYLKSKFP